MFLRMARSMFQWAGFAFVGASAGGAAGAMVAVRRGEVRRGDEEEEVAEAGEGAVAGGGWWARWAERVMCTGLGRAKVGSSRRLMR